MKTITKAVYADAENKSVRITYSDGSSLVIRQDDTANDAAAKLKEWIAAGNTVEPHQSGEEAGDKAE